MGGPNFPENPADEHQPADEERNKSRKFIGLAASCLILIACLAYVSHLFSGHPFSILDFSGLILFLLFIVVVDRIMVPRMHGLDESDQLTDKEKNQNKHIRTLLDGLASDCVVLHDVNTGPGIIHHLIFRKDGAVFLVSRPDCASGGKPSEQGSGNGLVQNTLWLRNLLKIKLGFEPRIHAARIFRDTGDKRPSKDNGFSVVTADSLGRWMNQLPGDPLTAAALWPQVGQLKGELLRPASIHLAPPVYLR